MLGKFSAGITANRDLLFSDSLFSAVSVPLAPETSRVILGAEAFLSMLPNIAELRIATPGSITFVSVCGHFSLTDALRSVASSVTVPDGSAVILIPFRDSIGVLAGVYFSATCHTLRKPERWSSSFINHSPNC